jgi:phage/plasmid-associated DNA primase
MKFIHEPKLPNELPIDESLVKKVVSDEWATCFLSYLVALYKEGNGWRRITPPAEVMLYTNEYKEESDNIAKFMREFIKTPNLEENPDQPMPDQVHWSAISEAFKDWKSKEEISGRATVGDLKKRLETQYGKMPKGGWSSFRFDYA